MRNEVNKHRNKESDPSRNQLRSQQKHDHQGKDQVTDHREKPRERSMHNQNNKQEQYPEKRHYNYDNKRNDTQPGTARIDKQNKEPEVKHEDQSGRSGRNRDGSGQQSNQTDGNYRKNYTKYDKIDHKKLDGIDNTNKTARAEYSTPNYRNKSEKQGRVGEGGEVEQNAQNYRERTGADSQNPQQSVNQHHGRTQYSISNREKEDVDKRAENVSTKKTREDVKETPKNKVCL